MSEKSYLAARRRVAASYNFALKALGFDAAPIRPNLTESQASMEIVRRASAILSMAVIDLYLAESQLRGSKPSEELIVAFAREVPAALEPQLARRQGTPVEDLMKALLRTASGEKQ